jgi:hypothetical protein
MLQRFDMKRFWVAAVLFGFVATAFSEPEQRVASVAGYTDLTFTLTDLDLNDGVVPYLNVVKLDKCGYDTLTGQCIFEEAIPNDQVPPWYRPRFEITYATVAPNEWGQSFSIEIRDDLIFELSPNTHLLIAGTQFASGPKRVFFPDGVDPETGEPTIRFVDVSSIPYARSGSLASGVFADLPADGTSVPFAFNYETGTQPSTEEFAIGNFGSLTSSSLPASAVPEPSAAALMAVGFLALGFGARRRRAFVGGQPIAHRRPTPVAHIKQ